MNESEEARLRHRPIRPGTLSHDACWKEASSMLKCSLVRCLFINLIKPHVNGRRRHVR